MSIEAAESYLPKTRNIKDAFQIVKSHHPHIGTTRQAILKNWGKSPERIAKAAGDFFTTGVAYLANRGPDNIIKELGTTTWWEVNHQDAIPTLTDNIAGAAHILGIPPRAPLAIFLITKSLM